MFERLLKVYLHASEGFEKLVRSHCGRRRCRADVQGWFGRGAAVRFDAAVMVVRLSEELAWAII
jgi:hypothetical protein